MVGWSPFDSPEFRQVGTDSWFNHYPGNPDTWGQYWIHEQDVVHLNPGDSGGPLVVVRSDGSGNLFRDVLGVAAEIASMSSGNYDVWTDVTSGATRDWVTSMMVDTSRTPEWSAKHPGYLWKGEVDYTGACQPDRDRDCDHWFDEHDDCPWSFNPDQLDTDSCPPCLDSCGPLNCGTILNGCNATLQCGRCRAADEVCGGGGIANVCGPLCDGAECGAGLYCALWWPSTTAHTCCGAAQLCNGMCCPSDATCVADTCCFSPCNGVCCSDPDTCGGGGVPGVCGCTPAQCGPTDCGAIADGCGATLHCGSCGTGQTCSMNHCCPVGTGWDVDREQCVTHPIDCKPPLGDCGGYCCKCGPGNPC
jgi:hypothetical protein